jgi:hypothetical protein
VIASPADDTLGRFLNIRGPKQGTASEHFGEIQKEFFGAYLHSKFLFRPFSCFFEFSANTIAVGTESGANHPLGGSRPS